MLNGLDLFSGIGGITLALSEWVRPVAYCENDPYAQSVLLSRISSRDLPKAPIWDDVRTLQGSLLSRIDIIYAGFPCQDISIAGNGKGLEGERSGLFFEVMRLAEEIKPKFIFLENVTNIRTKGLFRVVEALVDVGYDCRWDIFSARSIGADHNRRRWFLLAHSKHNGSHESEAIQSTKKAIQNNQKGKNKTFKLKGSSSPRMLSPFDRIRSHETRISQSAICGINDDVPFRVDRIKCLGNAVVPLQAKEAFKKLMGLTP